MLKKYLNEENRNIFWSFASKGWAAVAFILVEIIIARGLSVDQYGEWQYFLSTLTIIVTVSYFGVPQSAQTYAARYVGKPELQSVLKSSLVIRVLISLAFTGLIVLIRDPLANLVKRPHFGELLLYAAPLVFLMGMGEYLKNIYIGLKQTKYHFLMNAVEFGLKFLLVFLLLKLYTGISPVIGAYSAALFFAVLVGMVVFVRAYKTAPPGEDRTRYFLGSIFGYSLPLSLISLGFVVMTEVNTQMLGLFTTEEQVALFGVGKQIVNKLPQISIALSMGIMPSFAQIELGQLEEMRKKFYGLIRTNFILFAVISVALILLSPIAIPFIYGSAYREAVLPFQILSLRLVISTTIVFLNSFLDYQGKAKRRAFNFIVAIIANVVLNWYMIPRYGALGAAIATTISYIPYLWLNYIEVNRVFAEKLEGDG